MSESEVVTKVQDAACAVAGAAAICWAGDEDWVPPEWEADDWLDSDPASDPDDTAAWLRGLPADVREDLLAGPYTGAGEAIPVGYTHRDGGLPGVGFAAGGLLDRLEPSAWLARALGETTAAGERELGESELIGVLCGWRRMQSWAAAGEAAAVRELVRRRDEQALASGSKHAAEHVDDELAAALTLTGRSAGRLLSVAVQLGRLPAVSEAMSRGAVDWAKASLFADELASVGLASAREIAARLLPRAPDQTTGQLRAALRRAVLAADPDAAQRRQEDARQDTSVQAWSEPSGNWCLAGRELPAAETIAADQRLTRLARWLKDSGAVGTLACLRSRVYLALLAGRPVSSLLPAGGSSRTRRLLRALSPAEAETGATAGGWPMLAGEINLTLPLTTWLGISGSPGEVPGYGPVDAATGRDLAALIAAGPAARWCITVTRADGRAAGFARARCGPRPDQPVIAWAAGLRDRLQMFATGTCDHGRKSEAYRPPMSLVKLVKTRNPTCSAPGCRRSAGRCDLDHTRAWEDGGFTCECNLAPLCRRHHRAKQADGWRLEQTEPGALSWTLPSGRSYQTEPEPVAELEPCPF